MDIRYILDTNNRVCSRIYVFVFSEFLDLDGMKISSGSHQSFFSDRTTHRNAVSMNCPMIFVVVLLVASSFSAVADSAETTRLPVGDEPSRTPKQKNTAPEAADAGNGKADPIQRGEMAFLPASQREPAARNEESGTYEVR